MSSTDNNIFIYAALIAALAMMLIWIAIPDNKTEQESAGSEQTPTTQINSGLAGIWTRIGGAVVDLLIVVPIVAILALIWGFLSGLSGEIVSDEVWKGRGFLLGLMVDCLITVVTMSGAKQATFGQRAVGIRTVRIDGQKITYGTAFVRYFVSIISSIMLKLGFAIAIFTKNKRTLHDLAAGTIVVKE